ncbi:MAG TPA: glycosyltransferase [Chthoniobacteraceae bacterium]|nr:glycosyltransferase [Chthoniobacteraceae bacterium]
MKKTIPLLFDPFPFPGSRGGRPSASDLSSSKANALCPGQSGEPAQRRIAMISTHGYVAANPPLGAADTGGQVVYVLELSKKLAQLGYTVDIWTRRFEDQPEIDVINEQVRVLRVPCGGGDFIPKEYLHESMDEWHANALAYIRRHRLSYEFINSHYWDAGVGGRKLADSLGIPHLHTPHSLGIWKMRQMEADFAGDSVDFEELYNFTVRNREEKRLYGQVQSVIATTPVQIDMLVRDYDVSAARIAMVTPGYDDTRFFPISGASRDAIRERLGFKGKVILALGRLARNKGYDLLIQGFAEVAARVPDATLHLAAGGEACGDDERELLKTYRELAASLDLADRVVFSGFIPEEELPDVYRAADLFVLSSRYEPFGMTAVEAMASGTPVVATTHGGLWRVLRFGVDGLYADPFDALDLGITMSKPLIHPGLHRRLSRFGSEAARQSFTWSGVAQQLIRAVEQSDGAPSDDESGESFLCEGAETRSPDRELDAISR